MTSNISDTSEPTNTDAKRDVALSCKGLWKVFGATKKRFEAAGGAALTNEDIAAKGWTPAVRNVSFDIYDGEIFVIMGLSGSGKSTLVRCLTRLHEPTAGQILLKGVDILAASPRELINLRRRWIGMVFQHFALLPGRTVMGNISFPLEVQGMARDERDARARELVELVDLVGLEDRLPSELSGGQQQRVGIARSLATDPALWVLDEPFSALDPLIRADLQDELLKLQANLSKTIVFITHDLDEAIRIADRIAIMQDGEVVQIGTPEELVMKPSCHYVERFTAKVAPATVVRVQSLIDGPAEAAVGGLNLTADVTVAEIAPKIISEDGPFGVIRDEKLIGSITRATILNTLVGNRPSHC